MRTADVARAGGILLLGRAVNAGALLAANGVLTRLLPVAEMGLFVAAFNLALVAGILGAGGVGDYLLREVARRGALDPAAVPATLRSGVRAALVSLGAVAAGTLALCSLAPGLLGLRDLSAADAAALLLVVVAFAGRLVVAGAWRGLRASWRVAVADGAAGNAAFLAACVALRLGGVAVGHTSVVLLYALANLPFVAALAARLPWGPSPSPPGGPPVAAVLGASTPMMVQMLTGLLTVQATVFVLAAVAGPHEVAFAGVALQVGNAMALLSLAAGLALAPELARLHAGGDRAEMARLCRLMSLTASAPVLPVAACLWTVGGPLCELALGPG